MTKEALRLALEALEMFCEHGAILRPIETKDAIKAALEAKDEPENTLHWHALNYRTASVQNAHAMFEELENFVAQRTWVGLTDKEIEEIWKVAMFTDYGIGAELSNQPFVHYARAIEAKLRSKNGY